MFWQEGMLQIIWWVLLILQMRRLRPRGKKLLTQPRSPYRPMDWNHLLDSLAGFLCSLRKVSLFSLKLTSPLSLLPPPPHPITPWPSHLSRQVPATSVHVYPVCLGGCVGGASRVSSRAHQTLICLHQFDLTPLNLHLLRMSTSVSNGLAGVPWPRASRRKQEPL